MTRFDSLLTLRQIQTPSAQNQALFEWIRQHQPCWNQDTSTLYRPFNDCDWGDYKEEVFQWINGNGIWQDAWESILLSRALGEYTIISRPTGKSNAFSCPDGRAFLMEQISGKTEPFIGIFMLRNALWTWDENSQSPPTETERYRAMQIVLPWLKKEQTQYEVLYFIRTAFFHPTLHWKDKYGIFPLVELKKAQDETRDDIFKAELERLIGEIERR